MFLNKEGQLLKSLTNKEYRDALAIEHVNTTLATQIRKMRENEGWLQSVLAKHLGNHQESISRWENPDYGRYSISSLRAAWYFARQGLNTVPYISDEWIILSGF